jgi:hypothetical protein
MSEEQDQDLDQIDAKVKLRLVMIRAIIGNTNPRSPLCNAMQKLGWTVFGPPPAGHGDLSLWQLATSDDTAHRSKFTSLMEEHDPDFCQWAGTFLTQGQQTPVELREGGKNKDGKHSYTLVFGCRRCLAILFNWCMLGKPKEPRVRAQLVKGNTTTLLHRAIVENTQKPPTAVEQAKAAQLDLNMGLTEEEVCQQHGVSLSTLKRWQAILQLPEEIQNKIHYGTMTVARALKEKTTTTSTREQPAFKPPGKKQIKQVLDEFAERHPVRAFAEWVLGMREDFKA